MLRESDFIQQLRTLAGTPVHGLDERKKADIMQRLSAQLMSSGGAASPAVEWVPFVTGRRPVDDASFPGLGSSDNAALIVDSCPVADNQTYLLYRLTHVPDGDQLERYEVRLSLSFAGPWGDLNADPLPQWNGRVVTPQAFQIAADGTPRLSPVDLAAA